MDDEELKNEMKNCGKRHMYSTIQQEREKTASELIIIGVRDELTEEINKEKRKQTNFRQKSKDIWTRIESLKNL